MEFRDYLEKFGITTSDVDGEIWQAIEHLHGDDKRYLTGAYLPFLQFLGDLGCTAYTAQNGIYFKSSTESGVLYGGFSIKDERCVYELTHRKTGKRVLNTNFPTLFKLISSGDVSVMAQPGYTKFRVVGECVSAAIKLHNAWQSDVAARATSVPVA